MTRAIFLGLLVLSAGSLGIANTGTTLALTSSNNPSLYNQTVTLTATVSPSAATGSVSFYDGGSLLGAGILNGGTTTLAVSTLSVGTHSLVALYGGDLNYATSVSSFLTQNVLMTTTTMLSSSLNPSAFGQSVTFTATVLPSGSTGVVSFYDGVTMLGARALAGGHLQLTTAMLPEGARSVKAYYLGDATHAPSTSASLVESVGAVPSPANGFRMGPTFAIGELNALAEGDFNGDGKADFAAAGNGVSIFLGNGDGTFQPPVVYSVPGILNSMVVADFNGDGKADLAVAAFTNGNNGVFTIDVFLGNGDGTFQPGVTVATGPVNVWSLAVGDLNLDGKIDLIGSGENEQLLILLGNGDGSFQSAQITAGPAMALGDFNGDGKADLAAVNTVMRVTGNSSFVYDIAVNISLGNGDATFQSPIAFTIASEYVWSNTGFSVVVGDFNMDGKADLAVFWTDGGLFGLFFLGNGDGTFQESGSFNNIGASWPRGSNSITLGDFNGDGKPDFAIAGNGIGVFLGNGDGTFQQPVLFSTPVAVNPMVMGDFNGDGKADLAVAGFSSLNVLLGGFATHLKFTAQPVNSVAGSILPPVVVQSQDTNGNLIDIGEGATVALTSTPQGVSITVPAVNGATTFNNLVLNTAGSYTLTASSTAFPTVTSNSFTISPGTPTKLVFSTQPSNGIPGAALSPAVAIQIQDQYGNVVTGSSASVTISSIPAGVSATVNAQNGVATFSTLVFNTPGTYALVASSSGFSSVISISFTIANPVTVSGLVNLGGVGLAGVTINVTGLQTTSTTTNQSGIYSVSLAQGGTFTLSAWLAGYVFSAPVTFSNLNANQTANFTGIKIQSQVARAALRDTHGAIQMTTYGSNTLSYAGGVFASDPSASEDASGNVFVTARDTFNSIWVNIYNAATATWAGWSFGGGIIQGVPALAVDTSGKAWIASRDAYNSYWLVSYTNGGGFGPWIPLLGIFSTDPLITSCSDGSIYLIGKDNFNSLWSGHYLPGTGFQGWQFGGGVIKGKPAATCGGDNALYVAAEDNFNSNWIARVSGNTWTGWFFGGAITSVTPRVAALGNGTVAVVILDSTNVVWRTTFTEGAGNGWQPWTQVGGILQDVAPAALNGQLYFAGKAPNGDLWWWQQTGSQWTWIGNNGVVAGLLSAMPR